MSSRTSRRPCVDWLRSGGRAYRGRSASSLEALAAGPQTSLQLFEANGVQEEAQFLGDTWFWRQLEELALEGLVEQPSGGKLPTPPPRGDWPTWTGLEFTLTDEGRALVAAV